MIPPSTLPLGLHYGNGSGGVGQLDPRPDSHHLLHRQGAAFDQQHGLPDDRGQEGWVWPVDRRGDCSRIILLIHFQATMWPRSAPANSTRQTRTSATWPSSSCGRRASPTPASRHASSARRISATARLVSPPQHAAWSRWCRLRWFCGVSIRPNKSLRRMSCKGCGGVRERERREVIINCCYTRWGGGNWG